MKQRIAFFGLLLGVLPLSNGCAQGTQTRTQSALSEATLVQQVFDARCTSCHGATEAAQGLRLDSWEHLIAGSDHGEAIIPYDAENSLLLEMATTLVGGPHPAEQDADTLTQEEIDLLKRWVEAGAPRADGTIPYSASSRRLYVCNQDAALISVIDMEANVVIRTVKLGDLGFSINAKPHHTAVEPDGSFWYVSLIGANKVLKFNRANELIGQADFEKPGMLAVHPSEGLLFVGRSMAAVNPPQRIGVINRADMSIEEIDVFFARPHALAVDPRGGHVYTASLAENRMATIDLETEQIELTTLDGETHTLVQFALSPDGNTMVVSGQLTGKLMIFDTRTPTAPRLLHRLSVNAAPWHPVFSPDGRYVYIGNKRANTVTILDVERATLANVIEGPGLAQPHGSAVSPDGQYVYISNNNLNGTYTPRYNLGDNLNVGTVVVINTATQTIEKVIEVEGYAAGLGTLPPR